jgi:hypothetical protein
VRTELRKARQGLVVRRGLPLDEFYRVWVKSFERQGLRAPHSLAQVARLDAACAARGVREIVSAHDEAGRTHAVNYFVWSNGLAHGLLSGADPDLRRSGAQTMLLWEAITHASERARVFDFSGSMMRGIAPIFRDFGARQTPYLQVMRSSNRLSAVDAAHKLATCTRAIAVEKLRAGRKA